MIFLGKKAQNCMIPNIQYYHTVYDTYDLHISVFRFSKYLWHCSLDILDYEITKSEKGALPVKCFSGIFSERC